MHEHTDPAADTTDPMDTTSEIVYHPADEDYKWVRSENGWIAGVCQGLADSFNLPVGVLRACVVLFTFLAFGTGLLVYLILAFCLPEKNSVALSEQKKLLGVCLRLSRAFNLEVGLVRALTVFLALASFGITVVGYVILHFLVPDRPNPVR